MKMKLNIIKIKIAILFCLLLSGCTGSTIKKENAELSQKVQTLTQEKQNLSKEISDLKKENSDLNNKVQTLEKEIDILKNEPQNLFASAYDEKNKNRYDSALKILQSLRQQYPDFQPDKVISTLNEYTKAKAEYDKKQAEVKRIQDEEKRIQDAKISKEQKIAQATKSLNKTTDKMESIDWYDYFNLNGEEEIFQDTKGLIKAYIGVWNDKILFRFKMKYFGRDWLFIRSVLFKVDDETFELTYDFLDDWERNNSSGYVWEWKDVLVNQYIWKLINKIANSNKATMRFRGTQYNRDRDISYKEKAALKEIIRAYEAMGGKPPEK
jgi:predicted nuclease with TOPRIM domain